MLIKIKKGWELPESAATSEHHFLNRRQFMGASAAGLIGASVGFPTTGHSAETDPSASLYPFARNEAYTLDRPLTDEADASTYNNFYEFGSHKKIFKAAQALKTRPWTVVLDGDVESPMEIGIDDLIKKMPHEERLYRHRCVEAWSMAVPWSGFPLSALVELARPLSKAKYVRMETFNDPEMASGQKQVWYPWPYVEGLTMEEATNDLAFMVTGVYGHPIEKQYGAPLRIALPWKYGFKSIKSIVRFTFTDERPRSFWEDLNASEYGFWANVNPQVSHPRWSQATERVLGTGERVPTLLFNGYGEQVASMYKNMDDRSLFM